MSLFFSGVSLFSSKERKAVVFVGNMNIARLTIHLLHVEEGKFTVTGEGR